jgi:predicted TIM-barrel fold metal-dependent hydrolase
MQNGDRGSRSAEIRAHLSHPVIDADGHCAEFEPLLLDFIREVGGQRLADQYRKDPDVGMVYQWNRMTPEQRRHLRVPRPNWWAHPAANTLDRATSSLPRLLYHRLDEMGLDFVIVYPSITLRAIHIADDELRRAACRAFNRYQAELFSGLEDRLTPVAAIPMHTPAEALEELDYAVGTLGLKAILMSSYVRRPIPAFATYLPPSASRHLSWLDTYAIDSEYDYDPVWRRCVELGVAPTFHSGGSGFGTRAWISNQTYNHIGHFASADEAICKSLFLGGVTRRFSMLRFAFQEGGAGWARSLYGDLIGHWKIRNRQAVEARNPARLDHALFAELAQRYGGSRFASAFPVRAEDISELQWGSVEREEDLDEWAACGIERLEDIRDLFVPSFFFGCEGDDTMTPIAFDTRRNPFGAELNVIYGSDLGHLDLPDMRDAAAEAWELVEEGLINENEFRRFVFENPVRLHGAMNPNFFKGTIVEQAAAAILGAQPNASNAGTDR